MSETNKPAGEGILRDRLAAIRTILANERTLLAYIRTALAVSAAGAFLIKLGETPIIRRLGMAAIPAGVAVLAIGIWRYRRMQRDIERLSGE